MAPWEVKVALWKSLILCGIFQAKMNEVELCVSQYTKRQHQDEPLTSSSDVTLLTRRLS